MYISVMQVVDTEGNSHVVTAPGFVGAVGNLVTFNGNVGKVVRQADMKPDCEEFAILSSLVPIREADGIYAPRYVKEENDAQ